MQQIPKQGSDVDSLLAQMEDFKANDARWKEGRTWSMVYHIGQEHNDALKQASNLFFSESYINPFAFESLQRMEREVVQMTANMLNAGEQAVGTMTSGGTESLFLALYTYREWARKSKKLKGELEVIAPVTIHPAFEKAAHILGLKVLKTPVDEDGQAIVPDMAKRIGPQTLMLAVSAPSYPHGVLDPIEAASELALEHDLPLHVDSCIGGFLLPWWEQLRPGALPLWDFRLSGVTSMTADTHKFAYGAKGSSVLLYRSMNHLRHQFFITTDWPGGIYASSTLLGSRSGGPIAAAWMAMNKLGQEGYLQHTAAIIEGVERMRAGLEAIPELTLIGKPCMNILAFTTRDNKPDIFVIGDQLEAKGWYVDRQQRPNCIHITIMKQNLPVIDDYLSDLSAAIAFAKANPRAKSKGNAALYGLMARIPFRGMVEQNVRQMFEELYANEGGTQSADSDPADTSNNSMPEPAWWMGALNRVLSWWKRK
jgi:glutamate/tyrosine decarboxylase-like PLP-dependent enzyme